MKNPVPIGSPAFDQRDRYVPVAWRSRCFFLALLALLSWDAVARLEAAVLVELDAAELYQAACAICHGPTGRLDPKSERAGDFEVPPADFTDPLFSSREPADDWFLVVKHGGKALGLSSQMPAFGEAFSEEQMQELVRYVKGLAGDHRYPPGELNFFRGIRTQKAFPEDEVVLQTRYEQRNGRSAWKNAVEIERRIGRQHQVSLELIQEIEGTDGRLSELEAGWKTALWYDLEPPYIVSAGVKLGVPLRTEGWYQAIPFVAAATEVSSRFTLQASARCHLPFEDLAAGDFEAATIVHWVTTPWPRGLFPALEAVVRTPFDRGDADAAQVSLVPQLHAGLNRGGHVRLNLGVELPLTRRTYDYRIHLHLIWDWADGWFWERW